MNAPIDSLTPIIAPSKQTRLLIVGERRRRGVLVFVDGTEILLARGLFRILIRLVIHRDRRRVGFLQDSTEMYPRAIHALRKAIDQTGTGTGVEFVETGQGPEYRLGFHPRGEVLIDPSAEELVEAGLLSRDEFEYLWNAFGIKGTDR